MRKHDEDTPSVIEYFVNRWDHDREITLLTIIVASQVIRDLAVVLYLIFSH